MEMPHVCMAGLGGGVPLVEGLGGGGWGKG